VRQDTKAANAAATANAPAVRQEASIAQQTASDATAAFFAISLALATLYVVAGTKRANQNRYARADEAVRSVSLS